MNAMALFSLYLYFFSTSQSQPRVDAMAKMFFLPLFHVVFKVFQKCFELISPDLLVRMNGSCSAWAHEIMLIL